MRRHVTAILLMSFVWASPSPACDGIDPAVFETLLLPVPQVTPGRFGSMWESRFSIYNGNGVDLNPNFPDQDIFPFDNGCQFPECPQVPVVRANSRHVPLLYPTSMPGTLLYVRREYAERVSYSLRIQDVSRQALTWGTEIPVVRESDFVSTPLQLFDVPTDERFRQALRVYETGGRDDSLVRLDVYSSEDQIIATTKQFHRLDGRQRREDLAQDPDAVELLFSSSSSSLRVPDLLMSIAGKMRLSDELAVEVDFHVARALELLEDDVVHARAGVDQRRRDDRERAALLDVARRAEEALRPLQRVRVDAARQHLARRRHHGVVGARETRDRVEQDHDVALVLDEALGLLDHHLGHLHVARGRLVEGRLMTSPLHRALHVGDFFRALVDQQHDQRRSPGGWS
jgi:hypothetical protein